MVDPDIYNRGRNAHADPEARFDWQIRDLCDLLADLWGNEMSWDRFLALDEWYLENKTNGVVIYRQDSNTPTLGAYPFSADWINDFVLTNADLEPIPSFLAVDVIKDCFANTPQVAPDTIKAFCSLVFKADAASIAAGAQRQAAAAKELYDFSSGLDKGDPQSSMPAFIKDLQRNGWTEGSLSSDSFFDFCGDLSDLTSRYAEATYQMAASSAAASAIIARYQEDLIRVAANARTEVIRALKYWQTNKAAYTAVVTKSTTENLVTQIADGVAMAADVVGMIPVAGGIADPVGIVATIVSWAAQGYEYNVASTSTRDAKSIYGDLVDAVVKAETEMVKALDGLQSRPVGAGGSFETYVKDSQNNGGWNPPSVCI